MQHLRVHFLAKQKVEGYDEDDDETMFFDVDRMTLVNGTGQRGKVVRMDANWSTATPCSCGITDH